MNKKLLILSILILGTSVVNAKKGLDFKKKVSDEVQVDANKSIATIFENGLKIVAVPKKPIRLEPVSKSKPLNRGACTLNVKSFEGDPREFKRPLDLVRLDSDLAGLVSGPTSAIQSNRLYSRSNEKTVVSLDFENLRAMGSTLQNLKEKCPDFEFKVVPYEEMEEASYKDTSNEGVL